MKRIGLWLLLALLLLLSLLLAACGADTPEEPATTTAAATTTVPATTTAAATTTAPATTTAAATTTVPATTTAATTTVPATTTAAATTTAPTTTAAVTTTVAPSVLLDTANTALLYKQEPYRATLSLGFDTTSAILDALLSSYRLTGEQYGDGDDLALSLAYGEDTYTMLAVGDRLFCTYPEDGATVKKSATVNEGEKEELLAARRFLPKTDLALFSEVTVEERGGMTVLCARAMDTTARQAARERLAEYLKDAELAITLNDVELMAVIEDGEYREVELRAKCTAEYMVGFFPLSLPLDAVFLYTFDYEGGKTLSPPEDAAEYEKTTLEEIKEAGLSFPLP